MSIVEGAALSLSDLVEDVFLAVCDQLQSSPALVALALTSRSFLHRIQSSPRTLIYIKKIMEDENFAMACVEEEDREGEGKGLALLEWGRASRFPCPWSTKVIAKAFFAKSPHMTSMARWMIDHDVPLIEIQYNVPLEDDVYSEALFQSVGHPYEPNPEETLVLLHRSPIPLKATRDLIDETLGLGISRYGVNCMVHSEWLLDEYIAGRADKEFDLFSLFNYCIADPALLKKYLDHLPDNKISWMKEDYATMHSLVCASICNEETIRAFRRCFGFDPQLDPRGPDNYIASQFLYFFHFKCDDSFILDVFERQKQFLLQYANFPFSSTATLSKARFVLLESLLPQFRSYLADGWNRDFFFAHATEPDLGLYLLEGHEDMICRAGGFLLSRSLEIWELCKKFLIERGRVSAYPNLPIFVAAKRFDAADWILERSNAPGFLSTLAATGDLDYALRTLKSGRFSLPDTKVLPLSSMFGQAYLLYCFLDFAKLPVDHVLSPLRGFGGASPCSRDPSSRHVRCCS